MTDDKAALRAKMRALAGTRADIPILSAKLRGQLHSWPLWQSSVAVAAFAPLGGEPDALDPWPEDKRIALPRVSGDGLVFHWVAHRNDLRPGSFGVPEPPSEAPPAENEFGLILVPGLAFDPRGGRLGRGKGFYDRFLAGAGGVRAGVCFDDQVVEDVPREAHDLRMDFVVTPSSIYRCGS
ncbi:MAG: 5-formyltetrahydrofolate cyclo-ligase [Terrimicrobiaceae bacterium]|jgi:5-formyltetrahydrofolate cyclo-ligase